MIRVIGIILLSLGSFSNGISQATFPSILTQKITEKSFKGKIGPKPITLHLELHKFSDAHANIYSVTGWYHYDADKVNIPLAGIYDGDLTLYSFPLGSPYQDTLLNFLKDGPAFWQNIKNYKNLVGYGEKMMINSAEDNATGIYRSTSAQSRIVLNTKDLAVHQRIDYLLLKEGTKFNLSEFKTWQSGYEVVAHDMDSNKVLLYFEYTSRPYALGRCGADEEKGYLLLSFDEDDKLADSKQVIVESCLSGIEPDAINTLGESVKEYHLYNYNEETKYTIVVDSSTLSIKSDQH